MCVLFLFGVWCWHNDKRPCIYEFADLMELLLSMSWCRCECACMCAWMSEWAFICLFFLLFRLLSGSIRNALPSVFTSLSKSLLECEPTSDEHAILLWAWERTFETNVNDFNFKCIECSYGIKKIITLIQLSWFCCLRATCTNTKQRSLVHLTIAHMNILPLHISMYYNELPLQYIHFYTYFISLLCVKFYVSMFPCYPLFSLFSLFSELGPSVVILFSSSFALFCFGSLCFQYFIISFHSHFCPQIDDCNAVC